MPKSIKVTIDGSGKAFVETEGYKGPGCVKAIIELFDEFAEIDEFERKPDYYEEEESTYTSTDIRL